MKNTYWQGLGISSKELWYAARREWRWWMKYLSPEALRNSCIPDWDDYWTKLVEARTSPFQWGGSFVPSLIIERYASTDE